MPFHAFLSTWISTTLGHSFFIHSWKEILLLLMCLPAVWLLKSDQQLRQTIFKRRVNQLIAAYVLLHILYAVLMPSSVLASSVALKTNLNFLLFFILAQLAAYGLPQERVARILRWVIIVPALVIAIFGVLQVYLLPFNFLVHFGYGPETIEPMLFIDGRLDFPRIHASMSGPNQLGSYLLLPILLSLVQVLCRNWLWLLTLPPQFITLYASHSRSAFIGLLAGVFSMFFFSLKRQLRAIVALLSLILGSAGIVLILTTPLSGRFGYLLFHADPRLALEHGSSATHFNALLEGTNRVLLHPLGDGLASAGPSSFYTGTANIPENYYLQIAQEVGVFGLLLFLAISFVILRQLLQIKDRQLGWPLLGSFVGLSVINLFLHGWTDSTAALLWWGTAGMVFSLTSDTINK